MIKHKVLVLGLAVFIVGIPAISNAAFYQSFGGRVLNQKAIQLDVLEKTGWTCAWLTGSVTITPVKGPASYLITNPLNSTRTKVAANQQILGLYSPTPTPVTCTFPNGATQVVSLPTITIPWGTSRQ